MLRRSRLSGFDFLRRAADEMKEAANRGGPDIQDEQARHVGSLDCEQARSLAMTLIPDAE
jgi:hypothetical protein